MFKAMTIIVYYKYLYIYIYSPVLIVQNGCRPGINCNKSHSMFFQYFFSDILNIKKNLQENCKGKPYF